jgi:hypothetical protein
LSPADSLLLFTAGLSRTDIGGHEQRLRFTCGGKWATFAQ